MFLLLRAAEWKRGSGHKLKNTEFHKNMRINSSIARVTKNLHRLPWLGGVQNPGERWPKQTASTNLA